MSSLKDLGQHLQASQGLVNDERWQLAMRVAASEEFRRSARLRDFLLFICKKTLQEPPEEVHEQYIGCAVFGRRADYNPGDDNIVRAEARELRKRLEQYFAGAGKEECLEIRIPKGSYVPAFRSSQPESGGTRPSFSAGNFCNAEQACHQRRHNLRTRGPLDQPSSYLLITRHAVRRDGLRILAMDS